VGEASSWWGQAIRLSGSRTGQGAAPLQNAGLRRSLVVRPARTVTRTNGRGRIKFSCQYPGMKKKIPLASRGPPVWSPITMEKFSCITGLSYWSSVVIAMVKSLWGSGERAQLWVWMRPCSMH
jgi:hypothetical protein